MRQVLGLREPVAQLEALPVEVAFVEEETLGEDEGEGEASGEPLPPPPTAARAAVGL